MIQDEPHPMRLAMGKCVGKVNVKFGTYQEDLDLGDDF